MTQLRSKYIVAEPVQWNIFKISEGVELANIKSAIKRNRQNEKRREKNAMVRSTIRTTQKKVTKQLDAKEGFDNDKLQNDYNEFVKTIDTAARKGVVHWKKAARKKSRLAKKVNAALQQ